MSVRRRLGQQGAAELLTLPVAVEPVKEILATSGWVQRTSPTDGVLALEQGTTLTTPGGIPACSASYHHREEEQPSGDQVLDPPEPSGLTS